IELYVTPSIRNRPADRLGAMALFGLFGGKPSRDDFAALVAKKLKASGLSHALRYEKTTFTLHADGGPSFNLENAYRYYCDAASAQRERVLAEFFASWSDSAAPVPKNWQEAAPQVLPYVRPLQYFSLSATQLKLEGQELKPPPHLVIGEDLGAYLAFDR